ncbi:hypothetical protein Bca52824_059008 [Brassica carinata]|uniref:Uncharacterized protein n=1 Tax=Brassica carinata TaxID=52824 RepID=A0A8X7QYW9_BRACI|nr:hypothetical protein Bca52824_059008 [Brassica carinata]
MGSIEEERPLFEQGSVLLQEVKLYAEDGSVDIHGNPPLKQKTGNWKACPFILGNECCERLAYYGIAKNLVTYFTTKLHETNVSAARHVMIWQGTCYITPLIGALIADAYWGRYWTIACFSAIYFTGMATLTLSASFPGLKPAECIGFLCPPATTTQSSVFFVGLYLISLGTGGIKPCVSSFGADQFDDTDPHERPSKTSFFNWFYFSINIGAFVSSTLLVWVQENCGWGLGFLIPTVVMGLSREFLLWCLDKAAVITEHDVTNGVSPNPWKLCTVTQVEEVKILLRMFPIWVSGIVFTALQSQIYTLFVQQGQSMKHTIGSFEIPPATLGMFDTASVLICIPIYDKVLVPFVRRFTGRAKGFTDLQRMGVGLLVSVLSMAASAIVETKRLRGLGAMNIFGRFLSTFLWAQRRFSSTLEVKLYAEDGSVDIHGNPPLKQKTGNWKACPFILGNECCERLAYYGIAKNLVTYFTTKLHETNVSAARHVMIWQGTCYITPLIGALIADAYWEDTGLLLVSLPFISPFIPGLKPAECIGFLCPPATTTQSSVFFVGLYLISLGTGGIKPCVSSFGADQFDDTDPHERPSKTSFFNWFYFSINIGAFVSSTLLVWVQENCGWGLGFLIPTVVMGLSLVSFFCGTPLYRFQKPGGSPVTRVSQVLVAAYRKMSLKFDEEDHTLLFETQDKNSTIPGSRKIEHTYGYKKISCLDKAAVITEHDVTNGVSPNPWKLCTVTQVEEVKILLRMFPIWVSGIVFTALQSQIYTLFVQQGQSMKHTIGSFEIPPLHSGFLVPFVRRFTGRAKGFTDLQRMGVGLLVSVLSMAASAIVETKRLRGLGAMNIFWQVPQYFLMGTAEVFFYIGQVEFYYEQSPDAMRSLCSALPLLSTAFGSYLSSLILSLVAYFTTMDGQDGWIPSEDIDKGHLDYFFWLLVCFGCANIPVFVFFSVKHLQKKAA